MHTPTIPGYRGLEPLGSGGFAVVYKATQHAVGREVALKLLHASSADEETERRFERECRVVGSLSWHPHIAAVLDAGVDAEGRSFLAFELLPGGSLGDRLDRDGPLPWSEAIGYTIQTADALAAAHAEDVLHRDVKPDNILLDRLGRAKLADFGIAQMHDGNQTKSGVITATLAHAAPEVLAGQRASELSDVYLLGSTLFELIAGAPPFGRAVGDNLLAAIHRIATEPAPSLSVVTRGCPPEVATIVAQALEKDPGMRPDSAAALGLALREVQAAHGIAVTEMPFVDVSKRAAEPEPTPLPAVSAETSATAPQTALVAAGPDVSVTDPAPPVAEGRPGRSILPWAVALILVAVGVMAAVLLLNDGSGEAGVGDDGIVAREVLQTGSSQGLHGELIIDGDLETGWLSPTGPDGHELVIGFGELVQLEAIVVHAGPGSNLGPLDNMRGLGAVVLEFSDGTETELELDETASVQTVPIDRATTSLAIRSVAQGIQPVAIREVEFLGMPTN